MSILILVGCAQHTADLASAPRTDELAAVTKPDTGSASPMAAAGKLKPAARSLGHWKQDDDVDSVSGDRTTMFSNKALSTFNQFGAPVTASLYLYCDANSHQAKAAIYFSDEVGMDQTSGGRPSIGQPSMPEPTMAPSRGQSIRYRFDTEPPTGSAPLYFRGHGQQADIAPEATAKILATSHLRLELELPWAEDVSLEFDTKGAGEARSNLPC